MSTVIAIDGPAASGKGTLAKRLALHYGLPHMDTGLLYRAVARALLDAGAELSDETAATAAAGAIDARGLADPRLRERVMGAAASRVSSYPGVRAALLEVQRGFAAQPAGAVLDGRDIGTVVCPTATVKLYVTATAEERARRRHAELISRGERADLEAILDDIRQRDHRDSTRSLAPLKPAADASVLDTTKLDPDAAFCAAREIIEAAGRGARAPARSAMG
jgi:cytidylate kinase